MVTGIDHANEIPDGLQSIGSQRTGCNWMQCKVPNRGRRERIFGNPIFSALFVCIFLFVCLFLLVGG